MLKSAWTRWGIVLGLSLGGFFDGILLHQILQWHHLLSLVPGMESMRLQLLWDGYFHALMYVIAAVGLVGLWHAHRSTDGGGGKQLLGAILVGFGLWHIVDGVASHWVLGIHRIKLDSPNPLLWDLIWFAAFGLVPVVIGWFLMRSPPPRERVSAATVLLIGVITAGAAAWSLKPPPDQPFTTVVFAPGVLPEQVGLALSAEDARLIWSDPAMGVVVIDVPENRQWNFYRRGALLVSGAGALAGCFDWSRI